MNRGDRREDIFRDDADRERFLWTLAEACAKTEWQVHAYCLMSNHTPPRQRWGVSTLLPTPTRFGWAPTGWVPISGSFVGSYFLGGGGQVITL